MVQWRVKKRGEVALFLAKKNHARALGGVSHGLRVWKQGVVEQREQERRRNIQERRVGRALVRLRHAVLVRVWGARRAAAA